MQRSDLAPLSRRSCIHLSNRFPLPWFHSRDATNDQITIDAAKAIQVGVIGWEGGGGCAVEGGGGCASAVVLCAWWMEGMRTPMAND